jgi:bacterial/archaeal transporter family protein
MLFAGFTSVIAKKGLTGISGDLGLTIRTCFVFVFVLAFSYFVVPYKEWSQLKVSNWLWLAGSAVTTTASWIFYYRAIGAGEVSTVALIDKGSVVVAVLLAYFFLHESISVVKLAGTALIVSGLLVMTKG